jgi:FRG domain
VIRSRYGALPLRPEGSCDPKRRRLSRSDGGSPNDHRSTHAHVRVWFRGQPQAGWALQPGVYRGTFPCTNEQERLRLECHLTQDFRVESAGLLTGRETEAELYFLEQHYGLPTRLLDWTHNPLPSLFFATDIPNADGELFVMDAYQMKSPGFPDFGVATSRRDVFVNALLRWTLDLGPAG